ncbi:DEAD/DEAH box helicase [Parafrankia sp. EUN1f]|uniref:DEAD/DEAH box helicase n=1 Tax=Parafrankia sp. EUN1f TaxID=102897 RepID=UPI0001C44667|nr:AAA domain-containing protein [Parafrankia sp. EUN1f]EFC85398.1 Superfamily I DNA and RNA helicase and helicase subunits-like protein [Parafrankia sp. EUN1f]
MATSAVTLPGGIAIVPSARMVEKMASARVRGDDDLDPEGFVDQLRRMSSGVPARVEAKTGQAAATLRLYTDTHIALLRPTNRGDGYFLNHVGRWSFQDHRSLAQGFLSVRCPRWTVHSQVRNIPAGSSSHIDVLTDAWTALRTSGSPAGRIPERHQEYLDTVERIILRTRDLERDRLAVTPILYRARRATREQRFSARGVYEFRLVERCQITEGTLVQVNDDRGLRGVVLRSENLDVTIRFDDVPDFTRIPAQGALTVLPSDVVYRAQLGAVAALRDGEAVSPRLLATLAEHRVQRSAPPDRSARPGRDLERSQLDAFQRARGEPDLLLVLGPPGTGKTWTITEMAIAEAAAGRAGEGRARRVLVTSQSNRAVDNVLRGLADQLRCVRVGNPEALTGPARELTAEVQVGALKDDVLRNTEPIMSALAPFADVGASQDDAGFRLGLLGEHLAEARQADRDVQARDAELDDITRRLRAPLEPEIAQAQAEIDRLNVVMERQRDRHARARDRYEKAAARRVPRWWAGIRRRGLDRRDRAVRAAAERVDAAERELATARAWHGGLLEQVALLVTQDSVGGRLLAEREHAWGRRERALTHTARTAEPLYAELELAGCGLVRPDGETDDVAVWEQRERKLLDAVGLARTRASLLDDWRGRIPSADEELKHELVSYADVIAATCIGVSTKKLLSGLDFDLAIVDEAGQIALPDLLVPLVRARRSVLVGDHKQLPPYLDNDVAQWSRELVPGTEISASAVAETRDIVGRSEFERLFERIGAEHGVTLTTQRRMPETVATFISNAFYGGVLATIHPGSGPDPLFTSPLAFVDTSDQPPARRGESRAGANGGISNRLEADLIAALLASYGGHHRDWAVIVPYREQVQLLRQTLVRRLGGPVSVEDNIGTVDAFQGNERDLIIYGFTRSNRGGEVGFLSELRRLNVAMTRTRRQLVLVGDLETLGRSRDEGFRALIGELRVTLSRVGDLRGSREIETWLHDAAGRTQ